MSGPLTCGAVARVLDLLATADFEVTIRRRGTHTPTGPGVAPCPAPAIDTEGELVAEVIELPLRRAS